MKTFHILVLLCIFIGMTAHVHGKTLEKALKKSGEENVKENPAKQFLKSVIDNELSSLTIERPNIELLIQKAKRGDPKAQYDLGEIYGEGSWLPRNECQHNNWQLKSAKQANKEALWSLYASVYFTLEHIQMALSFQTDIPEKKATRLHDTLQMLAAYNEKAFIPKYEDSVYSPKDKIDRLDISRYSSNEESLNVRDKNETKVNKDKMSLDEALCVGLWNEAKKGDIYALYLLGGGGSTGAIHKLPEKLEFLVKAGELGHIEAQYSLGYFLHWRAYEELEYGHCGFCAKIFPKEISQKQHLDETIKWLEQAAKAGHIEAQHWVAEAYLKSGDSLNALKWFANAAESGNDKAVTEIAVVLYQDENIKKACLEALSTIVEKQRNFDDSATSSIASTLGKSDQTKHCKQAIELFEMLARKGDYFAASFLGDIYSQTKGCYCYGIVDKNIDKAIYWYKKVDDRSSIARLYFEQKEYPKAFEMFKKLAEEGNCTTQTFGRLGLCYFRGLGTVKNYYQAYKWLLVYKNYTPEYEIDFAEKKLSPEMINKAQQEAAELVQVIQAETEAVIEKVREEEEKRGKSHAETVHSRHKQRRYSEWREKIESISKLLNQVLPKEKLPIVYDWIDEEDKR